MDLRLQIVTTGNLGYILPLEVRSTSKYHGIIIIPERARVVVLLLDLMAKNTVVNCILYFASESFRHFNTSGNPPCAHWSDSDLFLCAVTYLN